VFAEPSIILTFTLFLFHDSLTQRYTVASHHIRPYRENYREKLLEDGGKIGIQKLGHGKPWLLLSSWKQEQMQSVRLRIWSKHWQASKIKTGMSLAERAAVLTKLI
jgi:hypothetical protein